eukprot:scaffold5100_cov61-Phaeocystis_antarctica.AAC.1
MFVELARDRLASYQRHARHAHREAIAAAAAAARAPTGVTAQGEHEAAVEPPRPAARGLGGFRPAHRLPRIHPAGAQRVQRVAVLVAPVRVAHEQRADAAMLPRLALEQRRSLAQLQAERGEGGGGSDAEGCSLWCSGSMHRVTASGAQGCSLCWGSSGAPRLRATVGEHHRLVLLAHVRLEVRAREYQAAHARPLRATEDQATAHHAA